MKASLCEVDLCSENRDGLWKALDEVLSLKWGDGGWGVDRTSGFSGKWRGFVFEFV